MALGTRGVNAFEGLRQMSSREYRKTKRADDEARTRARIVEAAESLHSTMGPARTTVSAIAASADVTRATVYRHFPDDESLFQACSARWASRQQFPDPQTWEMHDDPLDRLGVGLADIYRYFRHGEQMITLIHRDADVIPPGIAGNRLAAEEQWRSTLLQPFPGRRRTILRAAVAHATDFTTWRSLCAGQGLSDAVAVRLMVAMVGKASVGGG